MSVLVFTEYIQPVKFKSGKIGPGKYRANGVDYVAPKGSQIELNRPYECDVETTQNGQWENHVLKSFFAIRQDDALPTSTPTPIRAAAPQATAPRGSTYSDADRQRLIVRQTALKAAVEFCVGQPQAAGSDPLPVAEQFYAWILEEEDRGLTEDGRTQGATPAVQSFRRPDAPVVGPVSHPTR